MAPSQDTVLALIRQFAGQHAIITTPRIFIHMTESLTAGVLLGQIVYWSGVTSHPDGWFYKSDKEWYAEIGISSYQRTRCLDVLKPLGVQTEVRKARGVPTLWYRLDEPTFTAAVLQFLQNGFARNFKTQNQETSKPSTITSMSSSSAPDAPAQAGLFPDHTTNGSTPKPTPLSTQIKNQYLATCADLGAITNLGGKTRGERCADHLDELLALKVTPAEVDAAVRWDVESWPETSGARHYPLKKVAPAVRAWRGANAQGRVAVAPGADGRPVQAQQAPAQGLASIFGADYDSED